MTTFIKEHFSFINVGELAHEHRPGVSVYFGEAGYTATCETCQKPIRTDFPTFGTWEVA